MSLSEIAGRVALTGDQLLVLIILISTVALFVWNRVRHDVVALMALLACVLLGLAPAETAFKGFGNHAVVLVAFVLVLSRGLQTSGAIDMVSHWLVSDHASTFRGIVALTLLGAVLSAFTNNVGALALLMPLGLQLAQRNGVPPGRVLMPLSYGSIFGGMTTLIGSPANLLTSGFREDEGLSPYGMFDFFAVGGGIALAGLGFVILFARLLVPHRPVRSLESFETSAYITEARIGPDTRPVGMTIAEIEDIVRSSGARITGLVRGSRQSVPPRRFVVQADDILMIQADTKVLPNALARLGLRLEEDVDPDAKEAERAARETEGRPLVGQQKRRGEDGGSATRAGDMVLMELSVLPSARLAGRSMRDIRLRSRFGVNLLAISRSGQSSIPRLRDTPVAPGDVLLMQGAAEDIADFAADFGCVPLADRPLRIPSVRRMVMAVTILIATVVAAATGLLPTAVAFACGVVAAMLTNVTPPRSVYQAIDWPVVVLLGALIPVAGAVESTGLAEVVARGALSLGSETPGGVFVVSVLLIGTMLLSNVLNNAAAVAMMVPVAFSIASSLDVSPDPLLMAVAIGSQAGFLTPIGHQSNTLILAPSGLRFWDFWPLGLPLQGLVAVIGVPLILLVWPL